MKECHFGKVKLWDVEHFWTLFVFIFGRDCWIQQSRPKVKTKSVQKCSTCQSFIFPKWHSFKIGTLINDEICILLFFNTTFYLNQLPLYSFVYLDMYFFVDLLVKFRYCGKATKFEKKTSTFFKLFVLLRISELVSNGQCFFCHCIAVVLLLIYRNT